MRLHTCSITSMALLLCGALGCGTDAVEANAMFFSKAELGSPASGSGLRLGVILAPDQTMADGDQYHLRIDGQWAMQSPEDPSYVSFMTRGQTELLSDAQLVPGAHTFELVSPSGDVLLTTTAITLTAEGVNQIVIYGSRDHLLFRFFGDSPADGAAVAADHVLARFMNLRADRQSLDLLSCPQTPAGVTFSAADCTTIKSGLAYGELWEQALPRDLKLLEEDVLLPIDVVCLVDQLGNERTPSIMTYLMVAPNQYFRFSELSPVGTCKSAW